MNLLHGQGQERAVKPAANRAIEKTDETVSTRFGVKRQSATGLEGNENCHRNDDREETARASSAICVRRDHLAVSSSLFSFSRDGIN